MPISESRLPSEPTRLKLPPPCELASRLGGSDGGLEARPAPQFHRLLPTEPFRDIPPFTDALGDSRPADQFHILLEPCSDDSGDDDGAFLQSASQFHSCVPIEPLRFICAIATSEFPYRVRP